MNEGSINLENCHNAKPNKTTDSDNLRRKINEKSQIQRLSKYHLYRSLGVCLPMRYLRPQVMGMGRVAGRRVITLVYFSIN